MAATLLIATAAFGCDEPDYADLEISVGSRTEAARSSVVAEFYAVSLPFWRVDVQRSEPTFVIHLGATWPGRRIYRVQGMWVADGGTLIRVEGSTTLEEPVEGVVHIRINAERPADESLPLVRVVGDIRATLH